MKNQSTKVQPVDVYDIDTEQRSRVFEVSLTELPTFASKAVAQQAAKAIEDALAAARSLTA